MVNVTFYSRLLYIDHFIHINCVILTNYIFYLKRLYIHITQTKIHNIKFYIQKEGKYIILNITLCLTFFKYTKKKRKYLLYI